jgi:hypothetical protein
MSSLGKRLSGKRPMRTEQALAFTEEDDDYFNIMVPPPQKGGTY